MLVDEWQSVSVEGARDCELVADSPALFLKVLWEQCGCVHFLQGYWAENGHFVI